MFRGYSSIYILNVATSCAAPAINFVALLLITPVLLSVLGQSNYGVWLFLFALTQWFNLSRFGLDTALVRKLSGLVRNPDQEDIVYQLVGTLF